ncbi:MAG TPA: sigma-70 family RNA polymerase sigma factor [Ruminiclostridium sp.]
MEELVRKAQKGDDEAFYLIISNVKAKLYNTAYNYLKNESSALEAVSEATCRAYISIGKLKDCKYFSTWVTRIIINYCMDELRYLSKNSPMNQIEFSSIYIMDEESGIEKSLDLMTNLKLIKPKYRDVIILKYIEDISIEEIARSLNKPEGTIKTWINRGLKQLRLHMKGSEQYV